MNWLTNFVRPKIQALVSSQKDVPENLWVKCPECEGMLFHRDLDDNEKVCYHCNFHLAMPVLERFKNLFDDGKFKRVAVPKVNHDPLKFKDQKRYAERLKASQAKTKEEDAIIVASGQIGGCETVIAAFNFAFMGGSMGMAVGEGVVTAAKEAVKRKAALIVIPSSGGARMQEGALSLMQMPRTIIAVEKVKEQGLPYIVLLANPTTGGVSASFAMVGDIHIAEPKAMIGFAGKRVIEETIREKLPEGFQTAEYLLDHGMVDMVLARQKHNEVIGSMLAILMGKPSPAEKGKKKKNSGTETDAIANKDVAASKVAGYTASAVKKASDVNVSTPANTAELKALKKVATK
ncbi:MAG: acetyl-CoA carboxylase carboxyl transferase subunit beta [Micavibrio sp.]|nr:acetyl-CoA carboxylase carboxyl transferase subunit beta [Micavibrio sp.]